MLFDADEIKSLGIAALRLQSNSDFVLFIEEIKKLRDSEVDRSLGNKVDGYEDYVSSQGRYSAYCRVLELVEDIVEEYNLQKDEYER